VGTIFIPSDAAFATAKTADGKAVSALLENPQVLAQVW
jgi:hypothetical protein